MLAWRKQDAEVSVWRMINMAPGLRAPQLAFRRDAFKKNHGDAGMETRSGVNTVYLERHFVRSG